MSNRSVEDYLTDGMYGTRLPKQAERDYFLGTLRERIVLALTIGQVMSDKGLKKLEEVMQENRSATLIFNGHVAYKFLTEEKALADKYNIAYTVITNEDSDTNIGAVLAYDYAIDKENIYIDEEEISEEKDEEPTTFFSKLKKWFTF